MTRPTHNACAFKDAAHGTLSAQYEYGPFGEVIRMTGAMAKLNPFRFSTKYQDDETDLLYYGYRYYNASTGRWLSRDPINEPGFKLLTTGDEDFYSDEEKNLYGFVANRPIDNYNINGLFDPGTTCRTLTIVAPTVAVGIAALPVEAIFLGTVIVAEAVVITYELCSKPCQKRCKACVPEVGKQAIKRTDLKGKSHGGIPTPHSHIVQVNQSSYPECKCFWNNANPDTVPGIPNLKPLSQYPSPPSGGGPAN